MKKEEFEVQYKRLSDVHPMKFNTPEKMKTTWEFVKDLDSDWFRRLCDRVVMHPRGEVDIGEAALGEKRALKSAQFAEDVSNATANWNRVSKDGLSNVLEKYGVTTLHSAIEKSKKGL